MASLSFTQFLPFPRCNADVACLQPLGFVKKFRGERLSGKQGFLVVAGRRKLSESAPLDEEDGGNGAVSGGKKPTKAPKKSGGARRTTTKKKEVVVVAKDEPLEEERVDSDDVSDSDNESSDTKAPRRTRRKKVASSDVEKKVRRKRTVKKDKEVEEGLVTTSSSTHDDASDVEATDADSEGEEIDLSKHESEEDISHTYGWPPLVCCFGSAQHAFVPSGRPANRLLDYEREERMKDAVWAPEKYIRAPGGCAGGVAIALASLGGNVAFMGKLGDDDFGQAMLYYLNVCKVQTRSVKIDSKRVTACSTMKISKRGRLKSTCVKPCAEDSLSKSEINVDVLKEAKMFYFTTHSLLDKKMMSTTLQAIKISKQLGNVVFYDLNLPLPLWQSREETKSLIQQVWDLADVIEVTKQELEFLCGIEATEEFDTKNNDSSKFVHYEPETVEPLWHENLKVLFVTNGTSKIHYYTKEHNGAVLGMEDVPITPFTRDMSASGDGIVAGLIRMLTIQPDLMNDKGYLERTARYAIECGVVDQWLLAQTRGYPPKDDMEEGDDGDDEEEEMEADPNGIRSITEREYRTSKPYDEPDGPYVMKPEEEREYRKLELVGSVSEDDEDSS
ncbi:fructokinase-like 2 [Raphanus sativus]|uniref:Fructokinase-like 2, chloroplastic isoform X1 n=1 Tax=Raphanus sativus TaxID=3726 RepID=A0A9W3CI87_RAPSA|nr:fructokinase-like 2, chloroplastic isoform X1 [Raphanus sativus]KAJ4874633.1 fructokinase-like 2 [Raphanus sativus]